MTNDSMMPDLGGLSCQEMVELVTDYLEGSLPAGLRARFDRHLTACDPCVVYIDQMRKTIATLGRLPEDSVTESSVEFLRAHFQKWKSGTDA